MPSHTDDERKKRKARERLLALAKARADATRTSPDLPPGFPTGAQPELTAGEGLPQLGFPREENVIRAQPLGLLAKLVGLVDENAASNLQAAIDREAEIAAQNPAFIVANELAGGELGPLSIIDGPARMVAMSPVLRTALKEGKVPAEAERRLFQRLGAFHGSIDPAGLATTGTAGSEAVSRVADEAGRALIRVTHDPMFASRQARVIKDIESPLPLFRARLRPEAIEQMRPVLRAGLDETARFQTEVANEAVNILSEATGMSPEEILRIVRRGDGREIRVLIDRVASGTKDLALQATERVARRSPVLDLRGPEGAGIRAADELVRGGRDPLRGLTRGFPTTELQLGRMEGQLAIQQPGAVESLEMMLFDPSAFNRLRFGPQRIQRSELANQIFSELANQVFIPVSRSLLDKRGAPRLIKIFEDVARGRTAGNKEAETVLSILLNELRRNALAQGFKQFTPNLLINPPR